MLYRDPAGAQAPSPSTPTTPASWRTEPDEAYAFWDYGPELSRRFRALKVWMVLAHAGARACGEAIEANLECARHVARARGGEPDLELLAPVELSIFCFRYLRRPAPRSGRPTRGARARPVNERVLLALQRGGRSYLSNALVRGRFALRGCFLNYRTTTDEWHVLLDDVRLAASDAGVAPRLAETGRACSL